jgi:Na+-translocating ferredoxin:NAD+ oxidoreductase subunit C
VDAGRRTPGTPRKLWRFHGGLHLEGRKELSTGGAIATLPLPARLVLPLQQHIGAPAEPLVGAGERVLKGQKIAKASGYVSVPLHAPSSGTVVEIAEHPVPHPSGLAARCIVIETDGREEWCERRPVEDYTRLDPSALRNLVREAGIVGLGGAGFPAFIKLNPGRGRTIETLILNAAECEPYISCDDLLMRERAEEVIEGMRILRHAVQARDCIIGIEDNKPEAHAALVRAAAALGADDIAIARIPTIYPTGGEKLLIRVLTGKEVPSHGLPAEVGVVCHNVATAAAVCRAVMRGEPLISRIVTVTGQGIARPGNVEVPIGTPMHALIEHCGGYTPDVDRLVLGGPMMGFALHHDGLPVTKTASCLLAATRAELAPPPPAMPCIRCAECARACPVNLLPQQLYWYAHSKDFDRVQDYNLFDCIECGCCAYVCPSHIPLVQYYRYAKAEIWAQERDRKKAELARQRFEFRTERLERERAERAERLRQKKAAVEAAPVAGGEDPKKAAIAAALERVRAKQKAQAPAAEPAETSDAAGKDAE